MIENYGTVILETGQIIQFIQVPVEELSAFVAKSERQLELKRKRFINSYKPRNWFDLPELIVSFLIFCDNSLKFCKGRAK